MKNKRFISLITAMAMCMSFFANMTVLAENETYTADFTKLAGSDVPREVQLDEYTVAHFGYEGTTVDADGTIHLKGANNKKLADAVKDGASYVQFTAPSDGTVSFKIYYANYFIDSTYGYLGKEGTVSKELTSGQKLTIGSRSDDSILYSLSFTPSGGTGGDEPAATDEPAESSATPPYTSPETVWDFNDYAPASSGKNVPYVTGSTEYSDKEIKFPSGATGSGYITVDFDDAINNNVELEFDVIEHSAMLGQQYINCKISNSEGEEIVSLNAHPYQSTGTYAGVNKLLIAGEQAAVDEEIRTPFGFTSGNLTVHNKISIDYNAREVTVTVGSKSFTGTIPARTIKDIAKFEFSVNRNKIAADRYISFDNLSVKEFTSTKPAPEDDSIKDYTAVTLAEIPSRVKAAESGTPLVVYLSSKARFGTDNGSQVYGALDFFELLDGKATLAAPQAGTAWDTDALKAYIAAAKTQYNSSKVIVIGQNEGAAAAYALSDTVDKIIPINGASDITAATAKIWAFAGYLDENIENIRTTVSTLQKAKADVMYTEFPFDSGNIAAKVAETTGLTDWILKDTENTKVVDLVLFAGQSNMAGRGDYADATECLPGHGFEYHPVTEPGVLTTMSEPFGKYENNDAVNDNGGDGKDRRSGDMVSSFMESYYKVSGVPIVGVQCSRGGTDTGYWTGADRLSELAARYNEAKTYLENSGYTIRNKFMVWCQGETDADKGRTADTHKNNVMKMFNSVKSNTGLTDMFIVRIGHCRSGNALDEAKDPVYKAINLAQKELADANDDITAVASFYTDKYLALMRDAYHYYQPAYNSIGEIAGNNTAVTLYSDKGTWMKYPEPDEVVEETPAPTNTPAPEASAAPTATPIPVNSAFEITSSDASVDVTALTMYDNTTYRMYKSDGSYETVTATNGKITNTTGGEVTIVPEYKFEFTNQTNSTDKNIAGYVKVAQGSYTKEKGYGLTSDNYSINANGCKADTNPIKADLAEGFYDITVYRLGGARADVYCQGKLIANNTTSATAQNRGGSSALMEIPSVKLSEGSVDITFGNLSGNNERIASVKIVRVPEKYRKPVIWIAGDSESSNYYPIDANGSDLDSNKIMITGFGQQLGKVLSDKYSISNYGQPSATVKTWYDECFESVNNLMQAGDTILIDFGINEVASSSNKMSVDEMKAQMKLILDAAKAKNVTPILISPVYNGKYQNKAYFTYKDNTNAMYEFAAAENVKYIDLNKWTQLYANKAIEETGDANWITNNYHVSDKLHLNQHSALLAASFIAAGMKALGYETTDFAYNYTDISSIGDGNVRGTETENNRIYSVAAAEKFMSDGTIMKPGITVDGTTVTVTAETEASDTPVLIFVTRGTDNVLETVRTYNLTFENNTASESIPSLKNGDELYVWSSLSGMKPLAEKKTVTEFSQSVQ